MEFARARQRLVRFFLLLTFLPFSAQSLAAGDDLLKQAKAHLENQYGLDKLKFVVEQSDLLKQIKTLGNEVGFMEALAAAIKSFLNDDSHRESPLHLIYDYACERLMAEDHPELTCFSEGDWARKVKERGKKILLGFLNRESTLLRLLTLDERPEGMESPEESWIFYLSLPSLSDHLFWAVVDRQGKKPTYNYGFN